MVMDSGRANRWLLAGLVLVWATPMPTGAQEATNLVRMYELTELTADGATQSRAYALNNTGQIIGWIDVMETRHSAYWHNQSTTDLHDTVHFVLRHPIFDQDHSEAFDISNSGQVVGTARTVIDCLGEQILITNSYILRPAVLTDLATPYPGDALTNLFTLGNPCLAHDSAATGISNSNHVVGWADREDGVIHGFLVRPVDGQFFRDEEDPLTVNDLMIDLGTLAASDPVSSATGVNDTGEVTGYSYTTGNDGAGGYHAFLITPIDTDGDDTPDAWFTGASGVNNLMADLGTLGGTNSWGRAINNLGEIVGESDLDTAAGEHYTHAFYWKDGAMMDLGTLVTGGEQGFSAASAINDDGVVVGWTENDDRERRAFVYEDGEMQDLNDLLYLLDEDGNTIIPSITLTEARDINDDGTIVGWGTLRGSDSNVTRGFLLNPVMIDPSVFEEEEEEPAEAEPATAGQTSTGDPTLGPPEHLDTDSPTLPPSGFCTPTSFAFPALTVAGLWLFKLGSRQR